MAAPSQLGHQSITDATIGYIANHCIDVESPSQIIQGQQSNKHGVTSRAAAGPNIAESQKVWRSQWSMVVELTAIGNSPRPIVIPKRLQLAAPVRQPSTLNRNLFTRLGHNSSAGRDHCQTARLISCHAHNMIPISATQKNRPSRIGPGPRAKMGAAQPVHKESQKTSNTPTAAHR